MTSNYYELKQERRINNMKKVTSFVGVYYQRYDLKSSEDYNDLINLGKECHIDIYENQFTIINPLNTSHRDTTYYPASLIEIDLIKNVKKVFFFSINTNILTLNIDRDTDSEVYKFKIADEETGKRVIDDLNQFYDIDTYQV